MACRVQCVNSVVTDDTDCVTLSGTGTAVDPLIASLVISAQAGNTLTCLADGLYNDPTGAVGVVTANVGPAYDIDWTLGPMFDLTMTQDTTFTFSNDDPGRQVLVTLRGDFQPTWPAGVVWGAGELPVYTADSDYVFWVVLAGEVRGGFVW